MTPVVYLPVDVASRCTTDDPGPIPVNLTTFAACWAVTAGVS